MKTVDRERSGWNVSCHLLRRFLGGHRRLDHLLDNLSLDPDEARRCRYYLTGTVRNLRLLETALDRLIARRPRDKVWAILLLAAFELREYPDQAPKIVHFAVDRAKSLTSRPESGLINSVLRQLPGILMEISGSTGSDSESLGLRYSHPDWMVRRWLNAFGTEATRALLEWNQQPGPVHARVVRGSGHDLNLPDGFKETRWEGFVEISSAPWSDVTKCLRSGAIYIQDPATRLAPDLLRDEPPATILDLCGAPGGKAFLLGDQIVADGGFVVSVDLPGPRIARLKENAGRMSHLPVRILASDVRKLTEERLEADGLPTRYAAVLVDVPCSNTGVLRHRVDAKWRVVEKDIAGLIRLQGHLLEAAGRFVRPNGRLIYSTCSLERDENDSVVDAFVSANAEFERLSGGLSKPWETGHDGAGSYLLRRKS
ncbi:MAG: RNA methyltransferase [Verrucomicrobia bacterium]|nr:MAG: RNA methyltransferase [Verrucomicrobiota bacterium]